jgi:pyruvate dehydrogenase E2 component (dihydrolipoyllysine-residue acetyltransferase)
MPIAITMPALSPTMEEGNLTKWLVKEGDEINSGDLLAEIETDKATMEVEAVDEGRIAKILIPDGSEGVKVNTTIAILLEEGETEGDIDLSAITADAPKVAAKPETAIVENSVENPGEKSGGKTAAAKNLHPEPVKGRGAAPKPNGAGGRIKASPLAKRIAAQQGIDLGSLTGSGPHGRIVKRDVENAPKTGATMASAPIASALDDRIYPPDSYTSVKNDGMRKVIAQRLWQSFNSEVPHFPLEIECNLDALLAARARINALAPAKGEDGHYKVSVNDFIIKASALALIKVPAANASFTPEAILLHKHADIGVAVAIDGGLITPIVWQAETKGLVQISNEVKDMAARAKAKRLKPQEYQGGTFSVSNLGMFGIKSFASIINQPQGAIMSVGAGEQRPVVKDGELAIATMMNVTLTCDHRVVDGATGAQFLGAFKQFIEEPAAMLL